MRCGLRRGCSYLTASFLSFFRHHLEKKWFYIVEIIAVEDCRSKQQQVHSSNAYIPKHPQKSTQKREWWPPDCPCFVSEKGNIWLFFCAKFKTCLKHSWSTPSPLPRPGMGTVPDFQERVPERSSKKNAILCDPGTPVPGLERPKIVRSPVLLRYWEIFKKRSSAIQNF